MPVTYRRIYLDFNASTPIAPEVVDAMRIVLEEPFGNPSSGHWGGSPAREAVDKARIQVAGLIGCKATEIVFTSGGSEANNHALKGCSLQVEDRMLTLLPPGWNIRQ
jgi:cysteine desulfurase